MTGAALVRRKSLVQQPVVAKFDDRLTSKVLESSKCSNHIQASKDMIEKLIEVLSMSTLFFIFNFIIILFFLN